MIIDKADSLDPEGNSFFDFARKKGSSGYWWSKIIAESKSAFDRTTLTYNSDVLPAETTSPDSYSWLFQDLATIYKFLNNVAETYYGKQFLVEVPFACRYLDPVTKKFNYIDVPSADGGYIDICTNEKGQQIPSPGNAADDPDIDFENGDDCFIGVTGVIGLKHPLETDIFSDDVGKLPAILKFDPYLGYGKYHDEFQQWLYERNENGDIKYPTRKIQHKVPPNFIGADFPQDEFYTLGGGFDTNLEFDPFQPVYAKCEVEESWLVINKPIYITGSEDQEEKRCEYFPGDDTRPSYEDGGGITLNAILKLPEGVFLKAGVRENPDPFGIKPFPLRDRYQYGAPYYGNTNAIACTSFGNNFRLAQFWNDFQLNGGDNTSPPLFRDPTDMKRHNISVGDEIGMGSFPFAFPCNAILPIKSNTRTYGPFYRYSSKDLDTSPESVEQIIKGLPGKTYTEKDEGIAPWEYGGTIYMNEGANAKLSGIVRAQQESERGSITIAGYPNLQMGGALNEKPYYITNRYGLGTPRKLNVKGYASPAGLKTFLQLDTIPATTGNKSQITDISTQVSPTNVTTSYTLSTFTPVNGRFSRDNADRLKQQAQERYKRDREIRASKRQTANEELSLAKKRYKNLGLEVNTTSFVERSPAAAIAGLYQTKNASPTGNLNPPGQINTVINNVSGVARKEVLTQTVNQLSNLQAYDNAGVISMDGFFRPVRTRAALNSGLGPQLSVENDAADILGDAYQTVPYRSGPYKKQVRQSETPPGPLNDWTGLIINTTYLDFLVGPYTDLSARSINSGVGHDIELVARSSAKVMGKKNAGNLSVLNSGNEIQYSDTYRYMAHRGPLVVAGWGYDLYGKPIPNANETGLFSGIPGQAQLPQNQWTSGNAYNGLHRQDYNLLTDEFHSGFLSDPETWPVGPVDLRWDRKRSVWTVPNDFRIYVANLQEALSGLGNSVTAAVYNADDVYDESGSRPLDWEIEVTMPLPDVAIDAEPILVYYSHESGQWWPISYCCSSEGGGGGGTPPGGGDDDIPCDRCTGNCYWRWDGSKWNKMGSDNCDPNNDCFCQPPNYDGIPGTPSDLMISTNCAQVGCFGGGGGVQNLAGGSNDPIVYAASESNSVTAAKVYGSVLVDMPYNQSFTYGSGINPKYTSYTGLLVDITGTGHVSAFITDCIGTGNNTECFNRDVFNSGGFETFCVANVDNSYALPAGTKISVQFDAGLQCYRIIRYTLPNNGCQEVTASTGLYYYSRVMADASAGQVILDLPLSTATGIAGSEFYIKKIDASINAVIVSGTGSDLIDGQSTYTINNQYEAVKIVNCGANTWYVL